MLFHVWWLCLLLNTVTCKRGEVKDIKINEPRQSYSSYSNSNNNNNNNGAVSNNDNEAAVVNYRSAHDKLTNSNTVISSNKKFDYLIKYLTNGDASNSFDFNHCIEGTQSTYTYKVCLFEKVTQSENWYSWTLGIFNEWRQCDNNNNKLCLHYNDGQPCGDGNPRETTVELTCNNNNVGDISANRLFDITEPQTCRYHIMLYMPAICDGSGNYIVNKNGLLRKDSNGMMNAMSKEDMRTQYLYQLCNLKKQESSSLIFKEKMNQLIDKLANETDLFELNNRNDETNETESSMETISEIEKEIDVCDLYFQSLMKEMLNEDSMWLKPQKSNESETNENSENTESNDNDDNDENGQNSESSLNHENGNDTRDDNDSTNTKENENEINETETENVAIINQQTPGTKDSQNNQDTKNDGNESSLPQPTLALNNETNNDSSKDSSTKQDNNKENDNDKDNASEKETETEKEKKKRHSKKDKKHKKHNHDNKDTNNNDQSDNETKSKSRLKQTVEKLDTDA